jgi:hypothetical protein
MWGAEVCAQTVVVHNEGKIRRRTRAEKRFMGIDPFLGKCERTLAESTLACDRATAYWPEGQAVRDGYDLRGSRTVRHRGSVVRLWYSARVRILQVIF